jgi:uncharacterized protein YjbI with pentapeptide repeats
MAKLTREEVEQSINQQRQFKGNPQLHGDIGGLDLRGIDLVGVNVRYVDNISGTKFTFASLCYTIFERMNLSGINFTNANLRHAIFEKSNLSGANLSEANLNSANLKSTDFCGATLYKTDFSGADLSDANFSEVEVNGTVFGDVDLSVVKGLDTVRHSGPSIVSIETIYRSSGNIYCRNFLEKTGVPVYLIDYVEKNKTPSDCLYSSEQISYWITELKKRLEIYENNILTVKERMAQKGALKDVQDVNELKIYEESIENTRAEISEWDQHQEKGCPVCASNSSN